MSDTSFCFLLGNFTNQLIIRLLSAHTVPDFLLHFFFFYLPVLDGTLPSICYFLIPWVVKNTELRESTNLGSIIDAHNFDNHITVYNLTFSSSHIFYIVYLFPSLSMFQETYLTHQRFPYSAMCIFFFTPYQGTFPKSTTVLKTLITSLMWF